VNVSNIQIIKLNWVIVHLLFLTSLLEVINEVIIINEIIIKYYVLVPTGGLYIVKTKKVRGWALVAQAWNPSYSGSRDQEDVSRSAWVKSSWAPHLTQWLGAVAHACHTSYMGSINRRIAVQVAQHKIKWEPISKITEAKRPGGVAQVVQYLTGKLKTLSSTPTTANKWMNEWIKERLASSIQVLRKKDTKHLGKRTPIACFRSPNRGFLLFVAEK
jgi:hypothetical protein